MFGAVYSNRCLRQTIVSFGSLFANQLVLVRYKPDGTEQQRLLVPVAFGGKEKYIQALEGDPQNDKKLQMTLPQISFNMTAFNYDRERKLQSTLQNFATNSSGELQPQFTPVPWNINFELYIYVRNVEDGTQIVEQILPYFTPDYTLRVNLIPSMNITKDVPVILEDVTYENLNEGDRESETRMVIFTLGFKVKTWIYGPVGQGSIIKTAIMNIYDWTDLTSDIVLLLNTEGATGNYKSGELVFQGSQLATSNATATVIEWSNVTNRLIIQNATGLFKTNETLYGTISGAAYTINNYEIIPQILESVTVTPVPPTANIGSDFGFSVVQTFYNTSK